VASSKRCFLVGPIGDPDTPTRNHADWLLHGIIIPVFKDHFSEYHVERADKITSPGMIDSQIINALLEAELVIADMSFQNANAFYEMGIRHLKALPIIHMYLQGQTIPFDVKPYRAIPFKYDNPADLVKARDDLLAVVGEVIKPDFEVENPVTRARGKEKLEEKATEAQRMLIGELQELRRRIEEVEDAMTKPNPTDWDSFGVTPGTIKLSEIKLSELGKMPELKAELRPVRVESVRRRIIRPDKTRK
jgi:hypothetical protein